MTVLSWVRLDSDQDMVPKLHSRTDPKCNVNFWHKRGKLSMLHVLRPLGCQQSLKYLTEATNLCLKANMHLLP